MRTIAWARTAAAILAVGMVAAIAAACLPDNAYQRYQLLATTIQSRISWVYERTVFDPAPIDVVVIGPSRTGTAVAGPALAADLARRGAHVTAVNFSAPENGRDLHWVILQQVLATKAPKLIVVGVVDNPARTGHPAFKYIAPAADVVDPAFAANRDYLGNLIYLPYRQMVLFGARLFPSLAGLADRFDPAQYRGSNFDSTVSYRSGTGRWVERERRIPVADLEKTRRSYEKWANQPTHGRRLADIEFGNERTYIRRIAGLAQARHIPLVFLFLPYYRGTAVIQERALYEHYGPVLDASFLATHDEWFSDIAHLNHAGALVLSDWLAAHLVPLLAGPPHPASPDGAPATSQAG